MTYGSVLASFNVEEFGTERVQRLTRDEIDERFEEFRRMTALDAGHALLPELRERASPRPWNSRFGATTHGGAACPGGGWLPVLRQSNVSSCCAELLERARAGSTGCGGSCRSARRPRRAPSAVNGTSARR